MESILVASGLGSQWVQVDSAMRMGLGAPVDSSASRACTRLSSASQSVTFSDTAAALTGASYTGQALSLEMDAIAGLNQPTVAWHLGGASIEGSALYLFWEDPEGDFHNLYCVEQNLWALDWNQSELDQIPYDCENGQLDFNVLGDYTFADDEAPQKLHLRMLIMAARFRTPRRREV